MYNLTRADVESLPSQSVRVANVDGDSAFTWVLSSFFLHMPKEDESVTPSILEHGYWEAWITSWLTRWLRPGMTFLDVGANCGYYTMLAKKLVGKYGHVIAYEANPAYIPYLERTSRQNMAKFEIVNAAVTDDDSHGVELMIPANLFGSASIVEDFPGYETKTVTVPAITLDSQIPKIPAGPRIIKIDVEGAEEVVFDGAYELLHDDNDTTLLMEWTPGAYSGNFLNKLQDWGRVSIVNFDGGEESPRDIALYLNSLSDWCTLSVRKY